MSQRSDEGSGSQLQVDERMLAQTDPTRQERRLWVSFRSSHELKLTQEDAASVEAAPTRRGREENGSARE
jgi:hypothetical protein